MLFFLFGFFTEATSCDVNIQKSWVKAWEFPKNASRAIFRILPGMQIWFKSEVLIQD